MDRHLEVVPQELLLPLKINPFPLDLLIPLLQCLTPSEPLASQISGLDQF
jgi:hypothetical protein